jgi:hypothetical protein
MAKDFNIRNEPCDCPVGWCRHFVDPPDDCIHRLDGDVRVIECLICKAATWHQDGRCLRCLKVRA